MAPEFFWSEFSVCIGIIFPKFNMSKAKKLSHEDKRNLLLQLFYEKKQCFLLKELEKIAPKEKGIPFQTVKDVLTSLASDDLVDTDKIGTSTYFWAFPSKGYNNKMQKLAQLKEEMKELKEKNQLLADEMKELTERSEIAEEEMKHRAQIEEQIAELEDKKTKLTGELDRFKDCDPDSFESMESECKTSRESIDRWTDNIFAIKSWCKNKFFMEDSEINKNLGIPVNFDYYE